MRLRERRLNLAIIWLNWVVETKNLESRLHEMPLLLEWGKEVDTVLWMCSEDIYLTLL